MTFASEELIELGPFPQTSPLKGNMVLRIYEWTQTSTDTGGDINTGIGTTAGNGSVLSTIASGNFFDKVVSSTFVVATGVITIKTSSTGVSKGWMHALIRKS